MAMITAGVVVARTLLTVIIAVGGAGGAGCARVSSEPLRAPIIQEGVDFSLAPGQTAWTGASASDGSVRFVRVVEDSRCPREVTCAASGPVTIDVEIGTGAGPRRERLAILDRDVGEPRFQGVHSCTSLNARILRLRDVQPWPVNRKPVAPDRYRATFVSGASCGVPPAASPRPQP